MENNELLNFELLHRHIIGDIEKGTDEKIKEYGKYFFQNEAYRLFKKVDAIHVKTENGQKPVSNSVLAVTGERGSGKTSFLKTIEKELNKQKGYYTFPVIDPSSLHGDLNILEIVCTHIDIIIEEKRQKGHHSDTTLAEYRKIKNDLSKIILAADTDHKQSDNGLQRLDENRKKVQFDENFTKLLMGFLQLINHDQINEKKEKCILLIDDLDLVEDKVIYELTEHIRKYFNGQMIVILTYKEDQLNDVLLKDKMIKANDLRGPIDKEKLKDQCQKYTEKLIPYEHRIRLKNHKDFYGMNAESCFQEMIRPMLEKESFEWKIYKPKFFPGNIVNENDTLKQWFEKMTFYKSKVNIRAFDKLEQVDEAFANNLRGIIQWIETIYNMEPLNQEKIDSGDKNEWKKVIDNVEIIRTRVIRTTFDFLNENNRQFLEIWLNTLVEAKLYQAYCYFGKKVLHFVGRYRYNDFKFNIVDYRQVKSRNVSLADLIKIIDLYKLFAPTDGLFIYVFKILFSCELIGKYAQCYILNEKKEDYFELTRKDIIPNTKSIFSTNQKNTNALNSFQIKFPAKELGKEGETLFDKIGISKYSVNLTYSKLRPRYTISRMDNDFENYFGQNVFLDENIMQSNSVYAFHPLTILGVESYLIDTQKNRTYVLISLFDIDCFLEQCKYQSIKEDVEDTFRKLNEEILGEKPMFFTTRIFSPSNPDIEVFSAPLIDFIKQYAKEVEKILIEKPYKQSIINALKLLEDEFEGDFAMLDEISNLKNELDVRSYIRLNSIIWREKITPIFEKSAEYKLVLPNEK